MKSGWVIQQEILMKRRERIISKIKYLEKSKIQKKCIHKKLLIIIKD
jgi:hypothetical protein